MRFSHASTSTERQAPAAASRPSAVLISPGVVRIVPAAEPEVAQGAHGVGHLELTTWEEAAHWLPPGVHRFN